MKRFFLLPFVLLTVPVLAQHREQDKTQASKGEIHVYLADKDKKPLDPKDLSVSLIVESKGGAKKTLKTEPVSPKGDKKLGIGHGGEVVEADGFHVELVVVKPHGDHEEKGHEEKEHHEKGQTGHHEEDATPYFKAALDMPGPLAFSAVVVFKFKGETKNAKGFQYPPAIPNDYKGALAKIEDHLEAIDDLIKAGDLDKVHSVAEKISDICEKLPSLAAKDHRVEVEKTSKEIISLFKEIDEAADAGKKDETIKVANQYKAKVGDLKKHAEGKKHDHDK